MSYPEWEELFARCMAIHDDRMESGGFTGGKISLQQLKQYVCSGSDEQMQTQSVTRRMARELGRQETAAGFFAVHAGESGFFLRREGKGAVLFL